MTKLIDLKGQRFGKLVVLERDFSKVDSSRNAYWLCQCDCGRTHIASRGGLKNGDTKHCGCVQKVGRNMDITGNRYGQCVAVRKTDAKNSGGNYVWEFLCDCGATFYQPSGNIIHRGKGCCEECGAKNTSAATTKAKTTHGMSKTKEYKSWSKIRERCFVESCKEYASYGAKGITMHIPWKDDFSLFYEHIGPMPDDGQKYTCDRIDNSNGYVPGNVRWATLFQQARNQGKQINNTSGHTGVHIDEKTPGNFYACASWSDLNHKQQRISFSFKKYGEELAMLCAIEARDQAIRLLNMQGAGYTENHGK